MNPLSTKPTYLNYRGGANVSNTTKSTNVTTSASAPLLPSRITSNPGTSILLYIPHAASPSLSTHLTTLLSSHRIAAVHLLGGRDAVLKSLRTEIYTAAGRRGQDVAVSIALVEGSAGIEKAVREVGGKYAVLGALVCEWDDGEDVASGQQDVLDMETAEVEAMWRTSVLTLHTLIRSLLPLLTSTSTTQPFIYLDSATPAPFAASSRAALLSTLSTSPKARSVTIGPAFEHLIPKQNVDTQSLRSLRIDTNGGGVGSESPEGSPVFGAESPTKLWASWAAQYE